MIEVNASMEGAWWVVTDDARYGVMFYSSHDSNDDALSLRDRRNLEEQARVVQETNDGMKNVRPALVYRVMSRPGPAA